MKIPCLVVNEGSHAWWSMKIPCLMANERSLAWWSMGGSHAWWSMKIPCLVANEGSHAWWSMGGEEEGSLLPIPTSPWATLFEPSFYFIFYPLTLNFYFTMVLGHHLHLLFLSSAYKSWPQNLMSQVHPTSIVNSILLKIFPLFLESMASRMVTSYGPQAAQANEEPPSKSSLDLTLT
jgi:hypothetical protein